MQQKESKYIYSYDKEFDTLGISLKKSKTAHTEGRNINGIRYYVIIDYTSNKIIGIEIMNFSKKDKLALKEILPHEFSKFDFNSVH